MLFSAPKFSTSSWVFLSLLWVAACNSGGSDKDGQGGSVGSGGDGNGGESGSGAGGSGQGGSSDNDTGGTASGGSGGTTTGGNSTGGTRTTGGSGGSGTGGTRTNTGGTGTGGSAGTQGTGGAGLNFGVNESDPKAKNWVFLMCGQSNMSGTSPIEAEDRIAAPRVFKLTRGKTWASGTEGFNINPWSSVTGAPSALGDLSLSPSRTFAIELLKAVTDPNVNIYVVNAAMSGSNIESWEPGVGVNYTNMIPFLDEGLKMGLLRGFIWHQGEANGGTAPANYAAQLKAIIAAIRAKTGNAMMPAVAGEVGTSSDNGNVNQALSMIAASDPRFDFATSENLTLNDNVHYSAASEREFGKRYAAALLRIVKR